MSCSSVPRRLRELRRRRGLSQAEVIAELARLYGRAPFGRKALSHWESGRRSPPLRAIAALARIYDATPNDIMADG